MNKKNIMIIALVSFFVVLGSCRKKKKKRGSGGFKAAGKSGFQLLKNEECRGGSLSTDERESAMSMALASLDSVYRDMIVPGDLGKGKISSFEIISYKEDTDSSLFLDLETDIEDYHQVQICSKTKNKCLVDAKKSSSQTITFSKNTSSSSCKNKNYIVLPTPSYMVPLPKGLESQKLSIKVRRCSEFDRLPKDTGCPCGPWSEVKTTKKLKSAQ